MKINQLMALSAHAEEERKLLKESLSRDEEYLYGLMVMAARQRPAITKSQKTLNTRWRFGCLVTAGGICRF